MDLPQRLIAGERATEILGRFNGPQTREQLPLGRQNILRRDIFRCRLGIDGHHGNIQRFGNRLNRLPVDTDPPLVETQLAIDCHPRPTRKLVAQPILSPKHHRHAVTKLRINDETHPHVTRQERRGLHRPNGCYDFANSVRAERLRMRFVHVTIRKKCHKIIKIPQTKTLEPGSLDTIEFLH